jgi:hypothetical protein
MYSFLVLGLHALFSFAVAELVTQCKFASHCFDIDERLMMVLDAEVPSHHCPRESYVDRVIGYYEGWALGPERKNCNTLTPEAIPRGVYTHLKYVLILYLTISLNTGKLRFCHN